MDYRWFQYCFQGYELPDGQSAQQILNMAAVHDEIPLAGQASSAKRWMRALPTIEAIWQNNYHETNYSRQAQEDDAREFHMLREYSAGRLQEFLQLEDLSWFRQETRDEEMPEPQSTEQLFAFARVLRDIPIKAAIAGHLRWFHSTPNAMLNHNNFGVYENDPVAARASSSKRWMRAVGARPLLRQEEDQDRLSMVVRALPYDLINDRRVENDMSRNPVRMTRI